MFNLIPIFGLFVELFMDILIRWIICGWKFRNLKTCKLGFVVDCFSAEQLRVIIYWKNIRKRIRKNLQVV